jgi:hypothetical protein
VIFGASFDDEIFFLASTVVLEIFVGMVMDFCYGCREEDCPHSIYPDCYILDDGVSYSRLPRCVDKAVWLLFPEILMSVLLRCCLINLKAAPRACSIGITTQNYGRTLIDFYRFIIRHLCHYCTVVFRKVQDCILKKERV